MILADTSVWAHHIRDPSLEFRQHLAHDRVLIHDWVIGELALGNLPRRDRFLKDLAALPPAEQARDDEVLTMIAVHKLHGAGIGWVDLHLAASARLSQATLWTRDKRLFAVARRLDIPAHGLH